jgi:hypothetical protein
MLVRDEHNVAGGSARAMFMPSTQQAAADLANVFKFVGGDSYADAVDHLLARSSMLRMEKTRSFEPRS